MSARSFDVLVVGSGAAGLTAALHLATRLKVGVIAKGRLQPLLQDVPVRVIMNDKMALRGAAHFATLKAFCKGEIQA